MTDESVFALRFEKVLVAHHSPQNDCSADEGDVLYPPVQRSYQEHASEWLLISCARLTRARLQIRMV